MEAGTIFVLCLAAGFLVVVVYLAMLSRRTEQDQDDSLKRPNGPNR